MNTREWIELTRERAVLMLKAAERVENGETIEDILCGQVVNFGSDNLPTWACRVDDTTAYKLRPKRTYRPWTAKEWGARIGDSVKEPFGNTLKIVLVSIDDSIVGFRDQHGHWLTFYMSNCKELIQLDGTPCGTLETQEEA